MHLLFQFMVGQGKTCDHIVRSADRLREAADCMVATRISSEVAESLLSAYPESVRHACHRGSL